MKALSIITKIPERAILSVFFSCMSLITFPLCIPLMLSPSGISDQTYADAMDSVLGHIESTRIALASVALVCCIWSWRKEGLVPAVMAMVFTGFAFFTALFVDK
jgi:hypothetical protein